MVPQIEGFIKLYNDHAKRAQSAEYVFFREPNILEFTSYTLHDIEVVKMEVPQEHEFLIPYFRAMQEEFRFVVQRLSATLIPVPHGVLALWTSGAELYTTARGYMGLYCTMGHRCPVRHGIDYCCYYNGGVKCVVDNISSPCAAAVGALSYAKERWPNCF